MIHDPESEVRKLDRALRPEHYFIEYGLERISDSSKIGSKLGRGGLEKIADLPRPCTAPNHNPPHHIVLENGVYRYTCPACGHVQTFTVSNPTW